MSFAGNEQGISSLSVTQIYDSSRFIIIIHKKLNYFWKQLAANIATILVFFLVIYNKLAPHDLTFGIKKRFCLQSSRIAFSKNFHKPALFFVSNFLRYITHRY